MEVVFYQVLTHKDLECCLKEKRFREFRSLATLVAAMLMLLFGFWLFIFNFYWYLGIVFVVMGIYGLIYLPRYMVEKDVREHLEIRNDLDHELQYTVSENNIKAGINKKDLINIEINAETLPLVLPRYIYIRTAKQWAIIKKDNLTFEQMNKLKELWRLSWK